MDTGEGENVQMNTSSQRKKLSSPKKFLTEKRKQEADAISKGKWWPFKRADGKLLEYLHKQTVNQEIGEALL